MKEVAIVISGALFMILTIGFWGFGLAHIFKWLGLSNDLLAIAGLIFILLAAACICGWQTGEGL